MGAAAADGACDMLSNVSVVWACEISNSYSWSASVLGLEEMVGVDHSRHAPHVLGKGHACSTLHGGTRDIDVLLYPVS